MRYEEKIIEHKDDSTNLPLFKEAIVNIEFSTGDLIQLRDIIRKSVPNDWSNILLIDAVNTLHKVDIKD